MLVLVSLQQYKVFSFMTADCHVFSGLNHFNEHTFMYVFFTCVYMTLYFK